MIWRDALRVADPDGLLRLAAHAAQAKHSITAGVRSGTQARGRAVALLQEAAALMSGFAPGTSLQCNPYVPMPCPVVFRPDVSDASVRLENQAQGKKAKTVRNKACDMVNNKARVAKTTPPSSDSESRGSAFNAQQHAESLDGFRESLLALRTRRKDREASEDASAEKPSAATVLADPTRNKKEQLLPDSTPTGKNDCDRMGVRFYWHFDWSAVSLSRTSAARLRQALRRINDDSQPEKFVIGGALFVPLAFLQSSENTRFGADAVAAELKAARCLAGIEAVLKRLEAERQKENEKEVEGESSESKAGSSLPGSTSSDSNSCHALLLHEVQKRRRKPLPAELLGECIRALPLDEARSVLSAPLPNVGSTGAPWGVLLEGRLVQPKLRSKKGRLIFAPLPNTGMLPVGFTGPDWGDLARIAAAVLRIAAGVRPPRIARTPSQEGNNE